mgnify:CR=1 FL=1
MKIISEVIVEADGYIDSTLVFVDKPISFLGMVKPKEGIVDLDGEKIYVAGKVLAFPYMVGSTVAPYVIYEMKKNKKAPSAMITSRADALLASGCAVSDIPLFVVDEKIFNDLRRYNNKKVKIDGKNGAIEIE